MTLKEPIVEGAYYEREDGQVVGPARPLSDGRLEHWVGNNAYTNFTGKQVAGPNQRPGINLTRRVYITPTNPASVVEALRKLSSVEDLVTELRETEGDNAHYTRGTRDAYAEAADLVEEAMVTAPPKPQESS